MGFLSTLFGGRQLSPEEERQEQQDRNFDLLKYDGVKAMKTGQADYAMRCFREALKLKEDLEVRDYLSQVLTNLGDLEGAVAELRLLSDAAPDNVGVVMRQAQVAYLMEDYDQMVTACERATTLATQQSSVNSPLPTVNYFYAQAYIGQHNMVGAIAMLTKAIAMQPDYAEAYLLRGQTLLQMGDAAGAAQDVAWLEENVGAHEDVLMLKAHTEAARGDTEAAIATYGQVIEVNPFAIDAYRERGQLRYDGGDKAGAEADMQKVLELDPGSMADVNGEYSAEGIEQRVKQAYSAVNPLGL